MQWQLPRSKNVVACLPFPTSWTTSNSAASNRWLYAPRCHFACSGIQSLFDSCPEVSCSCCLVLPKQSLARHYQGVSQSAQNAIKVYFEVESKSKVKPEGLLFMYLFLSSANLVSIVTRPLERICALSVCGHELTLFIHSSEGKVHSTANGTHTS